MRSSGLVKEWASGEYQAHWCYAGLILKFAIRWLYSSCLECEICAINHTSCPYQKNAGAVRTLSSLWNRSTRLFLVHTKYRLVLILSTARTSQELSSVRLLFSYLCRRIRNNESFNQNISSPRPFMQLRSHRGCPQIQRLLYCVVCGIGGLCIGSFPLTCRSWYCNVLLDQEDQSTPG
jgi:ferredoxin